MNQIKLIFYFSMLSLVILTGCNSKEKQNTEEVADTEKPIPINADSPEATASATVLPQTKPYVAPDNLELYELHDLRGFENRNIVFISLSEVYPLSDHPDSLAIPKVKSKKAKDIEYFALEGKYRERFFNRTKVSKIDSLFIYDYANNNLLSILVSDLKTVAILSPYVSPEDEPITQNDYMLGFEIDNKYVNRLKNVNLPPLAFIGKESPFKKGQMKAIVWKKIDSKHIPKIKLLPGLADSLRHHSLGDAYNYESDTLTYFIQDYLREERYSARHLKVMHSRTKTTVFENTYMEEDGSSLTPINNSKASHGTTCQWTGGLFKAKPPVVFGFTYASFGCSRISFLKKGEKDIYTKCDNRH